MENFFKNKILFNEEIVNQMHIYMGSWLDDLMILITSLGHFFFFVFLLSIIFWCYDKKTAIKIGIIFILSNALNDILKHTFNNPRPDPAKLAQGFRELTIKNLHTSPGFPSGHTQETVAFWGASIYFIRKKIIFIAGFLMIILIPYSRIYLGLHFPGDLAGGYLFGISIILLVVYSTDLLEKHISKLNDIIIAALLIIIPIIISIIMPGKYIHSTMGLFSGFLLGAFLGNDRIEFYPKNKMIPNLLKISTGSAVLLLIFNGLNFILPETPIAGFLSSWLTGFTLTFIVPLIFSKIKILKGD